MPFAGLTAFAVGEVARGMPNRQAVVGGDVARAEARPAEGGLDDSARSDERFGCFRFGQREADRHAGGVNGERERAVADGAAGKDFGSFHDVVEQPARAARDDALIGMHAVRLDFSAQVRFCAGELLRRFRFHLGEQLIRPLQEFVNRVGVAGMERQRNHALDLVELDGNHGVVIRAFLRLQRLEVRGAAVRAVIIRNFAVRFPDGGKAGGFGGHYVHAVAEIDRQVFDAGADEFQHLVLGAVFGKGFLDEREGYVVRAYAPARLAGDIAEHDFRRRDIVSVFQKLFHELRPAFANGERAQSAVAGVAVRTQNHLAAAGQFFARVAVDDAEVGGHVDAAVLLGGGEAEYVIVLVDRTADGAKAVVAVRHGVWNGEFGKPARPRGLDDADIGDVVRNERVEAETELFLVAGNVVRAQDAVGNGLFTRGFLRRCGGLGFAADEFDRVVMIANHNVLLADLARTAAVCRVIARGITFHA
ncbi:hypothetical protein SDC9_63432 [bioreactor metagenome]|uniref:Uncharacterized protein n=1 Tax=bioreactor metagenome TaxID=1076179 RepID=A0A644XLS2_9ZZZZ